MKFHANSFNGFQRTVRTRNSIASYQWEITPKIKKAEFWFSSKTHCIIVFYNYMVAVFNLQSRNEVAFQIIKGK